MKTQKCYTCKKDLGRDIKSPAKHIFCSIECACYSGAFNIKTGWEGKRMKEILKEIMEDADGLAVTQT